VFCLLNIVISGGGVAGAGLACSLSKLANQGEVSITILEKDSKENVGAVKRGEVIRPEVTKAMNEIGVIDQIKENSPVIRESPRQEVWHSSAGRLGILDYEILARGYPLMYLPHTIIVKSLYQKINHENNIHVKYGAKSFRAHKSEKDRPVVFFQQRDSRGSEKKIECDLLVVAEGGGSDLRASLGIELDFLDYETGYLMAFLDKPPEVVWGRHCLSPYGFVGLFSMPDNMMRAAIELETKDLRNWLTLEKNEIGKRLEIRIPPVSVPRINDVGVFYHVIRRHARSYFGVPNFVLIGDAAHTTHPMMGQGMSMVFHDIIILSRLLASNPTNSFGRNGELKEYQRLARPFNQSIIINNENVFRAFQEIGKDPNRLDGYLPMLESVGFRKQ
jgi:2-octaprenyl-6-methoxyphenol hydroxylase